MSSKATSDQSATGFVPPSLPSDVVTDQVKTGPVLPPLPSMPGRTSQYETTIREEWFPMAAATSDALRDEVASLSRTVEELREDLATAPSATEHERLATAEADLTQELKAERERVNTLICLGQYAATVVSPIAKRLGVEPTDAFVNRELLQLSFGVGEFGFAVVRDQIVVNNDGVFGTKPAYKVKMTDKKGILKPQVFVLDDVGWTLEGLNRFDGMLVARKRGRDASKREMPARAFNELFAQPQPPKPFTGMTHRSLLGYAAMKDAVAELPAFMGLVEMTDRYSPEQYG